MSAINTAIERVASTPISGLAHWIRKHPLPAYFILAFAGAWFFIAPILLSQKALGVVTLPEELLLALFLLATFAGPTPAALIVTGITEGKAGVGKLLKGMVQWRAGIGWYLLVLIGYPLVFIVGLMSVGAVSFAGLIEKWPVFLTSYLPLILIGLIYPSLGEEPGWRGFALPRLQLLYGPLVGSLILGTLHALWHLPVYAIPGTIAAGGFDLTVFVANSLAIMAVTFVWTWLFNSAKGSILFAMFIHATSNAVTGAVPRLVEGQEGSPFFTFVLVGVVALLVIAFTRGKLGYKAGKATPPMQAETAGYVTA
jgi:membrane protease YdiL (CAAX protease family)